MRSYIVALVNLTSTFLVLPFLMGCDNDPDPCKDEKPVSADFMIYEADYTELFDDYPFIDTDTVTTDAIIFEAVEKDATYEWTLGEEVITAQKFRRREFPRGTNIDVSLKVTKTPNTSCFPDDDGVDTKTRIFYTTPNYQCDSRVNGSFEGYDQGSTISRVVTFETCAEYSFPTDQTELRITNLVEGCDAFGFGAFVGGYNQVYFGGNGQPECKIMIGTATLTSINKDSIKIEYSVIKSPNDFNNRIQKTFIGKRK